MYAFWCTVTPFPLHHLWRSVIPSPVVSREEWLRARLDLLADEKRFTRERDALSAKRRGLPRVAVEKEYAFTGPGGPVTLSELFDGRSQLLVYHFMYPDAWDEGCKSCSFWADGYDNAVIHLAHRDVTMVTVSIAPFPKLEAFRQRMGWSFPWVSSDGSDFNHDFGVTFSEAEAASGERLYNFGTQRFGAGEAPGISAFLRDDGRVYHTYSAYSRGIDLLNPAYNLLDIVPNGRDEDVLDHTMAWLRHHDRY